MRPLVLQHHVTNMRVCCRCRQRAHPTRCRPWLQGCTPLQPATGLAVNQCWPLLPAPVLQACWPLLTTALATPSGRQVCCMLLCRESLLFVGKAACLRTDWHARSWLERSWQAHAVLLVDHIQGGMLTPSCTCPAHAVCSGSLETELAVPACRCSTSQAPRLSTTSWPPASTPTATSTSVRQMHAGQC